jgi:DNA polymerase-3 subunit alpha
MTIKPTTYASLHNHTGYSNIKLIDSINKVEELIDYAYELGLAAVAITDHDTVSGHLQAIKHFNKKYKDKENFKLILGNEIYITREGLDETNYAPGDKFYHLILLAKDEIGHRQIRELSSRAWRRSFVRALLRTPTYPSDLFEVIGADPGHIVVTTACLGGYIANQWRDENYEKLENFITMMEDLLGKGNFFIELQPGDGDEQKDFNLAMIDRYWGKYPFVFTTDSHYLTYNDRDIHKAFLNSKSGAEREVDDFYSSAYMMSYKEINDYFDYIEPAMIDEMANNTLKIAAQCKTYTLNQTTILPKVRLDLIEDQRVIFFPFSHRAYIGYFSSTSDLADAHFFKLIALGWKNKLSNLKAAQTDLYIDRLEEELGIIREISIKMNQSLSDYFITMNKMIQIIWNEADSIVGPSRGSAGGFLINYLLEITQMDPLKQELYLPAWRFLHPERPQLPDIDIDTESSKRNKVFNKVQTYFNEMGGDLVNVCTFGTEGSKSALKTAARGLGIDPDVINYLTSMIPNERGFDWTLHQCYEGDDEHTKIEKFYEEMQKYPDLWQVATKIEGLITRLGVHASGVIAVNDDFIKYNSYMKTSKGQIVSAFDLHDSEELGLVKYDFLTVSALDRIRQTMNYLLEDDEIQWQGGLKKTYDKYLSPDVIDYKNHDMWDLVAQGGVTALFQFDTIVGSQAIRQIKPRSLTQLAIANSIMRLMVARGEELPLETYSRYKEDISKWYSELSVYGLNTNEIRVLEKHLVPLSGVADSQESVMMLSMDPQIANFTMGDANLLRKTIAKKDFREIDKVKELFYQKGRAAGNRDQILNYVWKVQVSRQLGYSFSSIHTTGYSIMALQEMNLAFMYPIIYWNTACLSVDASAINESDFSHLMDEGIIEVSDDEDMRSQNKTDYAKIVSAVDKFKNTLRIDLPDINKSRLGFTPNAEKNSILYGLKGITRITQPVIEEIMLHRPYKSLEDFTDKVTKRIVTRDKIVNLIKSGAFNDIEGQEQDDILKDFILRTCDQKNKLTLQNANMLFDYDLLPDELTYAKKIYKFTKVLRANRDPNKYYYMIPEDLDRSLLGDIEVRTMNINDRVVDVIKSDVWDKNVYDVVMAKVKTYITKNHDELLKNLNHTLFMEDWNKYASGDQLQWELDSLNFYYSGHPLVMAHEKMPVQVTPLNEVSEGTVEGFFLIKGQEIPRMKLYSIVGTVVDKDKTKGLVTLQTPQGVVDIKVYKDLFALYNHTISTVNVTGEKEVLEDSFFEKGTHLLVTGILRGSTFIPKVYKTTRGIKPVMRIILDEKGDAVELLEKSVETDFNNEN